MLWHYGLKKKTECVNEQKGFFFSNELDGNNGFFIAVYTIQFIFYGQHLFIEWSAIFYRRSSRIGNWLNSCRMKFADGWREKDCVVEMIFNIKKG